MSTFNQSLVKAPIFSGAFRELEIDLSDLFNNFRNLWFIIVIRALVILFCFGTVDV